MNVREEELVEDKVAKLDLVVKGSKKNIFDIQLEYELKVSELKMNF